MAVLGGRYELIRPIAQGGMATVYLAKVRGEGGFERLVALKLMHPHIAGEADFVSMFLDEARLAARIRHPNVVPTLAVERSDDGLFLVMEYIEGHPLHAILRTAGSAKRLLPIPVVLRVVIDLLEGLHAAHELKDEQGHPLDLVHRDVSPQNVLVGADGVSRITDFGVAQARARLATTQGSGLKGKVAYLAPEQVMTTGRIDRRADVFAAGIVLWESLTGRRLFRGETEGQTIAQIMTGARRSPRELREDVPPSVSDVCMRALSSDPETRYQSAVEFADALEAAALQSGAAPAKPREVAQEILALDIPPAKVDSAKLPPTATRSDSRSGISRSATGGGAALATAPPPRKRPRPYFLLGIGAVTLIGVGAVAGGWALSRGSGARAQGPVVSAAVLPTPQPAQVEPSAAPSSAPRATPNDVASAEPRAPAVEPPSTAPSARAVRPVERATNSRPSKPTAPGYRPEGL